MSDTTTAAPGAGGPAHRGERIGPRSSETAPAPPTAAKDPRGFARVAVVGVVCSVGLLALAVVAGHDALASAGALSDPPWVEEALTSIDGTTPEYWWVPVAALVAVIGLLLVFIAVQPRPHLGLPVRAGTGVFLLDRGLGRLAAAAAQDVEGVDSSHASGSRRAVRVDVRGLTPDRDRELERRVTAVLGERLQPLESTPRIRVRDRGRG